MSLSVEIEEYILSCVKDFGRDDLFREALIGYSDANDSRYEELRLIIGGWHKLPTDFLPEAQTVVSYFVPFTQAVCQSPASVLWGSTYVELNRLFDTVNQKVTAFLSKKGFLCASIPGTHNFDPVTLECGWSHRSAAVIAGLGHFAANRMVITPLGCGGRFCTLITDAVLLPTAWAEDDPCLYHKNGSCGRCFAACPKEALTKWNFDAFSCQEETIINRELLEARGVRGADICGCCVAACPLVYRETKREES